MRFLGIDYGHKKVGLALSDEAGDFAYPYEVIKNDSHLLKKIAEICRKEGVGAIVMGESLDYKGGENPINAQIKTFAEELKKETGLPLEFERETLTTREASREIGQDEMTDARAAALILRSYLERKKK